MSVSRRTLSGIVAISVVLGSGSASPSSASETQPAAELSLDAVLAAYESACESITSFDIYLTQRSRPFIVRSAPTSRDKEEESGPKYEQLPPGDESTLFSFASRQLWLNGKSRMDLLDTENLGPFHSGDVTIWDGGVEKHYAPGRREGRLRPYAKTLPGLTAESYLNFYRSFDGDLTYATVVRERSVRRIERRGQYVVLAALPEPDKIIRANTFGVELTLDPDRGFLPVQIDLLVRDEPVPQAQYYIELDEVDAGLWAPVRVRIATMFWMDRKSPYYGKELGEKVIELDRRRSHFNLPLDESLFAFEFPPGTMVYDEIRNTSYRIGAETRQDYLDMLAVKGRLSVDELKTAEPRLRSGQSPSAEWRSRAVLVVANLILLALLGLAGAYRWLHRRRTV